MPLDAVATIWTDGSCLENPNGPGGWAAIVRVAPRLPAVEIAGAEPATTNNRMELAAVLHALEYLPGRQPVDVYSDSRYVVEGINSWLASWRRCSWWRDGGPGAKANLDLWQALDAEIERHSSVHAHHVRGHSGVAENERCDELAGRAAREMRDQLVEAAMAAAIA